MGGGRAGQVRAVCGAQPCGHRALNANHLLSETIMEPTLPHAPLVDITHRISALRAHARAQGVAC